MKTKFWFNYVPCSWFARSSTCKNETSVASNSDLPGSKVAAQTTKPQ